MNDFYLQIDGIDGEVTKPPYVRWMEALSYSFEDLLSAQGDNKSSGGLTLTLRLDKSYPKLQLASTAGTHLKSATLISATKNGAPTLTVSMTDVLVESLGLGGPGPTPRVKARLFYKGIEVERHGPSSATSDNGKKLGEAANPK